MEGIVLFIIFLAAMLIFIELDMVFIGIVFGIVAVVYLLVSIGSAGKRTLAKGGSALATELGKEVEEIEKAPPQYPKGVFEPMAKDVSEAVAKKLYQPEPEPERMPTSTRPPFGGVSESPMPTSTKPPFGKTSAIGMLGEGSKRFIDAVKKLFE